MPNHWSHSRGPRTGVAWPYDRILVFNGCHRLQPPLSTTSQIAQILLSLSLTVLRLRLANCIGFWVSFTCGPQARRAWRRYRHRMHLLPSFSLLSLSLSLSSSRCASPHLSFRCWVAARGRRFDDNRVLHYGASHRAKFSHARPHIGRPFES